MDKCDSKCILTHTAHSRHISKTFEWTLCNIILNLNTQSLPKPIETSPPPVHSLYRGVVISVFTTPRLVMRPQKVLHTLWGDHIGDNVGKGCSVSYKSGMQSTLKF